MNLTMSRDGVKRATVRIEFRIDESAIAEAITGWAIAQPASDDPFDHRLRSLSRTKVEHIVRERLKDEGPPEQWREEADDDYYRDLREVADERVQELFG